MGGVAIGFRHRDVVRRVLSQYERVKLEELLNSVHTPIDRERKRKDAERVSENRLPTGEFATKYRNRRLCR